MISRCELGELGGMTLGSIESMVTALGASVSLTLRWQGEQLDRLMDASHATLQAQAAEMLTTLGWIVRVEASFNHYGDRGRVDIAALHPTHRILLVTEVKSGIGDLQDTLGRLDVKVRVGREIAREQGWSDIRVVVPALVIGDSRAARRTVAGHAALFARFDRRGRAALAWLRRPGVGDASGLLWYANRPDSHQVTNRRARRPLERPDSHRV